MYFWCTHRSFLLKINAVEIHKYRFKWICSLWHLYINLFNLHLQTSLHLYVGHWDMTWLNSWMCFFQQGIICSQSDVFFCLSQSCEHTFEGIIRCVCYKYDINDVDLPFFFFKFSFFFIWNCTNFLCICQKWYFPRKGIFVICIVYYYIVDMVSKTLHYI